MPKLTMLEQPVRKDQEQEEDRGEKAPVLLPARGKGLLGRLGSAGRGYALAGAGVVAAAVVAVSLLSWLAPDSDRPIASPLEAVGRVAGGVIEQVDDQVEALLETYGENTVLRSVREGLVAASSATSWLGDSVGIASSPSSSTSLPDSAPSSTDDVATPSRGEESSSASDGPPSQPVSSSPSSPSETPTTSTEDAPSSSPPASEPAPPAAEEPPVAEEPSTPPPSAEPPPEAEEPVPPSTEEPPPDTEEEPPPATEGPPPPVEGPPETSADE